MNSNFNNSTQSTEVEEISLRPMRLDDVGRVVEIDRLSFSLPWSENAYRYELLENRLSIQWVAEIRLSESRLEVIGMIVTWLIEDEAHIATIAVHPDFRSRGIGQLLLSKTLQEAILKGCRQATLEVRSQNVKAQRLYFRFGFEIVGIRRRYYRDNNEDALIMTVSNLNENYLNWLRESRL